jgi:hypothetical protein
MDGLIHGPMSSGKELCPSWKVVRTYARILPLPSCGALRKHTVFGPREQTNGDG